MGLGTLGEVRDGSRNPPGCLALVGDPFGGPRLVGGHLRWSGTGRGTLKKVRERLGDPR